jgi:hypothetical protein
VRSLYNGSADVVRFGPNVWSDPWQRLPWVFNCNFEVVSLARFRSPHYRAFWAHVNGAGLFWSTRLGDHQVKTLYVETFEPEDNVVCYGNLPYGHPNDHADGGPCGELHVGRTREKMDASTLGHGMSVVLQEPRLQTPHAAALNCCGMGFAEPGGHGIRTPPVQ